MLEEYALVPDVFDPMAYSKPGYADMCLAQIKKPLLHEALVRDLCDGAWSQYCVAQNGFHRLAGEILRKLASANRLHRCASCNGSAPTQATDWCQEALASSQVNPLAGTVAAHATKMVFRRDARVASIEKLPSTNWWQNSESGFIRRETDAYLRELHLVLQQANSLMFIDPNLDPSAHNYREFHRLLTPLQTRCPSPRLELHRSFCRGDGPTRTFPSESEWRQSFAPLDAKLKQIGLSAEVFFWRDFHDRYLITDIIGVMIGAGFDTTTAQDEGSAWARLSRKHREDWQRKFDPADRPKDLKFRFRIGATPPSG